MLTTKKVLYQVEQERINQIARFGKQEMSLADWYLILAEEVGEVAKAILEGDKGLYNELVQTAAVAVQILETLQGEENE